MNVLIINAYEIFEGVGAGKLNNTLVEIAKKVFENKGYIVKITNIEMGYDVEEEHDNTLWADIIFIQTPIYWFSVPSSFKSYIDKVYCLGHIRGTMSDGDGRTTKDLSKKYGRGGKLFNKKYMLSITANYPQEAFDSKDGFFDGMSLDETLTPLHKIFHYFSIEQLPTFSILDVFKNPKIEFDINRFENHIKNNI